MSPRLTRCTLWLLLAVALPLPYFMVETGRIPLAQLVVFTAVTVPLAWTDPSFTTRFMGGLFAAQSLVYGILLWIVAGVLARRLPPSRRAAMLAGLAAALLLLAWTDVYVAPLSHGPGTTNWLGLWR